MNYDYIYSSVVNEYSSVVNDDVIVNYIVVIHIILLISNSISDL